MNKYKVEVERISKELVEIEAENKEEARKKANNGDIEKILTPDYGEIQNQFIKFTEGGS